MMTKREARQRAEVHNASIKYMHSTGELRCTLNEWRGREAERKAYYTDDLEDAVLTIARMRAHA